MKKILFIDVCDRPESRTRILAEHLLTCLDGEVTRLDLFRDPVYPLNIEAIRQRKSCAACGSCEGQGLEYARQFADADIIVIAAPVWNLSFPSVLMAYCENIVEDGITMRLTVSQHDGTLQSGEILLRYSDRIPQPEPCVRLWLSEIPLLPARYPFL